MRLKTFASRILRELSEERRRVVSDWRVLILARRIARAENVPLPNAQKAEEICRELLLRGDIIREKGVTGVYRVVVAYANLLEVTEEQVVQEANPWAVLSFLTAMAHHGLTDIIPRVVYAAQFEVGGHSHRIPLGTTSDDWVDLDYPTVRQPRKVGDVEVAWTTSRSRGGEFGITIGYSAGVPIYVTDVERTLLDAIRMPEKCGGIAKVLSAWRDSESAELNKTINYTEQLGIHVVRQRVGYLLEKLGRKHPRLAEWQHDLQRGGSIKLVASEPYSEIYSPDWNLSLNVPPAVLAILE
jgi:predicted transcriptional regulator of viral defense system